MKTDRLNDEYKLFVPNTDLALHKVVANLGEKKEGLMDRVIDTIIKKNSDYSADNEDFYYNFKQVEKLGLTAKMGIAVRIFDKVSRYKSLLGREGEAKVDESLQDTIEDLVAYCLLYHIYE